MSICWGGGGGWGGGAVARSSNVPLVCSFGIGTHQDSAAHALLDVCHRMYGNVGKSCPRHVGWQWISTLTVICHNRALFKPCHLTSCTLLPMPCTIAPSVLAQCSTHQPSVCLDSISPKPTQESLKHIVRHGLCCLSMRFVVISAALC